MLRVPGLDFRHHHVLSAEFVENLIVKLRFCWFAAWFDRFDAHLFPLFAGEIFDLAMSCHGPIHSGVVDHNRGAVGEQLYIEFNQKAAPCVGFIGA